MISSYGTINHQGIILHIIIVLHQRCLNCSECLQRHLMFYTCNYNIRVTHRNGAIKHILYESDPRGIISRLFFIHFVAPCACSSSSGCTLSNLSVWRFEHVGLTYICRLYFPPGMPAGPHFVTQPILLSENIPNIWHKSSTKHKEVRPDWNDKNDNANYAPRITWKVLPMAQVAIFKEIFDQVRKRFRLWIVLFWTKTSQRLTLYLLSSHR